MNNKSLFARLEYDSQEAISLNGFQKEALENFLHKLKKGKYLFEEISCLCGSNNKILISEKDRYGLSVNTYLCKKCGMMWTSPRLTEKSLEQFYNEDYRPIYVGSSQAPDDFFEEQIRHGEQIYQFINSAFESKTHLTVFEIGCGAGGILIPFRDQGWLAYGCDMGNEYLKRGRQEGLILEEGNEDSLQKYGKADLIILSHVLEHFSDPLKSLHSIADLLKPDGFLYIELPGILMIHKTYGDILLFLQNAHLYHFTLNTLTSLMAQAGFKLFKGNEYIHALYQKSNINLEVNHSNQFLKILLYLYLLEAERNFPFLGLSQTLRKNFIKLAKSILGKRLSGLLKQQLRGRL